MDRKFTLVGILEPHTIEFKMALILWLSAHGYMYLEVKDRLEIYVAREEKKS